MPWFAPGFGWGRGWRWWFGGFGRSWRWCWWFRWPGRGWWWRHTYLGAYPEVEKDILKDEAEFLKRSLSAIERRLAQLEKEA
jgi:hypothetical protein